MSERETELASECTSCEGRGWREGYDGTRLCFTCDGCGVDPSTLTERQRETLRIVTKLVDARERVANDAIRKALR